MRQPLFLLLIVTALLAGVSGCIEQTPLNFPTNDVCGTPDPGDAVDGDASEDGVSVDATEDAAEDTTEDAAEDSTEDTTPEDTTPEDTTPEDTEPDVCQPACDGAPCGADDGCGGLCPGDCDPGWVCIPGLGDCFPESCTDEGGDFVATFADAILLERVNFELGTDGQDAFTWDEVKDLTILDANKKPNEAAIKDLSGLECLLNLETLWISGHGGSDNPGFTDVAPLAALLALTHLDLGDDGITGVTNLVGLSDLVYLDLGGNLLDDAAVAPLSAAEFGDALLLLDLSGNDLASLPPIQDYTQLRILDLASNRLGGLSGLSTAAFKDTLVVLHAEENWSADLGTGVKTLAGLEGFFANAPGAIPDGLADYVQDWRNKLVLYSNRVDSLDGLETMTALEVLRVSDNLIQDLAPMEGLGALTELSVSANAITDLPDMDAWAVVPPIETLDISWNPLVDPAPIGIFSDLTQLNLEAAGLQNLDFIGGWMPPDLGGPPLVHLEISINPFVWGTDSSPFFGLQTVGMTLKTLIGEDMFTAMPAAVLGQLWLPDTALVALEDLQLGSNGLVGENLEMFGNTNEGRWGALIKLHLEDNAIADGLGNLYPLAAKAIPLQVLTLVNNPIENCQLGVAAWDDVCANLAALQVFDLPATCSPCP